VRCGGERDVELGRWGRGGVGEPTRGAEQQRRGGDEVRGRVPERTGARHGRGATATQDRDELGDGAGSQLCPGEPHQDRQCLDERPAVELTAGQRAFERVPGRQLGRQGPADGGDQGDGQADEQREEQGQCRQAAEEVEVSSVHVSLRVR
jgi:hypothetical protein